MQLSSNYFNFLFICLFVDYSLAVNDADAVKCAAAAAKLADAEPSTPTPTTPTPWPARPLQLRMTFVFPTRPAALVTTEVGA